MKNFKFILFGLFLTHSYFGLGQWVELNSIPQRSIQVLSFIENNLGYALMEDESRGLFTLEKTSDGGSNWTPIDLPVLVAEFQDIHFYGDGQGVILIRNLNNTVTPSKLFQTVDDGATWQDISPATTANGIGIGTCQFLSREIGFFAIGKSLYATQDGGVQWTNMEFANYILALDFLDAQHGTLGTWDGTFAYRGGMLSTSDGGISWRETAVDEAYTSIGKVQCLSTNLSFAAPIHSWAAIQASHLYKSTDGGSSWDTIMIPKPYSNSTLRQVHFKDEMNGVVCAGNNDSTFIYHTINGGTTWTEKRTFSSIYNTDMQLTTNSGYITGNEGTFYRLTEYTSTVDLISTNIKVNLFPIPVQSGHAIRWTSDEIFSSLTVITSDGRKIYQQKLDQSQAILPNLNAGLYFIRLSNDKLEVHKNLYVE